MAEARSAASIHCVSDLEEGRDPKKDFITAWRKAAFRRYFTTRSVCVSTIVTIVSVSNVSPIQPQELEPHA